MRGAGAAVWGTPRGWPGERVSAVNHMMLEVRARARYDDLRREAEAVRLAAAVQDHTPPLRRRVGQVLVRLGTALAGEDGPREVPGSRRLIREDA